MGWHFHTARDAFENYRERWDELNKTCGNHILLDSIFVGSLICHFASDQTLLGISDDDNQPGMLIVDKVRRGFWQTFQPSQAPLGVILLKKGIDVEKQVTDLICSLPGYSLGLSVLQQDPDCTVFRNLNPSHSETVDYVDYIDTARINLSGTFEAYWEGRGRDLTRNLARRVRRATEEGIDLKLMAFRDPNSVGSCIREYGMLEAKGWKGKGGTAVTAENPQGIFYRDLLEKFCEQGEAVIYQLLMNGQVVASDLCVERNGVLVVLKIAYDETVRAISPSFLLRQWVLKDLFSQEQIKVVEFYGRVRDWHRKWTDEVRTMFHVNLYRDAWVPVARRLIKATRGKLERTSL